MKGTRRSLLTASATTTVASILGQAPGLFIPLAIAWSLGANQQTDLFFLALAFATVLTNMMTAAVQHAGVPFFVASQRFLDDGRRDPFLGWVLVSAALFTAVLGLVGAVLFPRLFGDSVDAWRLLTLFCLLLTPYAVSATIAAVWTAVLSAESSYALGAASPALRSTVALLCLLFLGPSWGVLSLVAGYVGGEALRAALLWKEADRRPRWIRTRSPLKRPFLSNAAAQGAGSLVLGGILVLDRMFAATLGAGAVSVLEYAERLYQVPLSVALSGFLIASLGEWSLRLESGTSPEQLLKAANRAVRISLLLMGVAAVLLFLVRAPLIRLLFSRGSMAPEDLSVLADTFGVLLLGAPLYVAGLIYTRPFLVLKRSGWLLAVSVGQLALKWVLNSTLVPRFGLTGLAAATSIMFGLTAPIFAFLLVRVVIPQVHPETRSHV